MVAGLDCPINTDALYIIPRPGVSAMELDNHVGSRHIPRLKPSIGLINSGENHCANDDKICAKLH